MQGSAAPAFASEANMQPKTLQKSTPLLVESPVEFFLPHSTGRVERDARVECRGDKAP